MTQALLGSLHQDLTVWKPHIVPGCIALFKLLSGCCTSTCTFGTQLAEVVIHETYIRALCRAEPEVHIQLGPFARLCTREYTLIKEIRNTSFSYAISLLHSLGYYTYSHSGPPKIRIIEKPAKVLCTDSDNSMLCSCIYATLTYNFAVSFNNKCQHLGLRKLETEKQW